MINNLPDQKARKRITAELDRSFLVEAGAGSGKTSSLIDRMVAIITSGRASAGEIAAVTFTRKAAGELRERFQEGLEKALEERSRPGSDLAARALEDIEHAFVGTIHSFCAMILRERPVEAGLDPGFTELDEEDDRRIISRAWDRYLLYLQAENRGTLDRLDKLDIKPGELENNFNLVTRFPEVELVTRNVAYPGELLDKSRTEMYRYLEKMEKFLPFEEPPDGWDGLQQRVRMGLRWRDRFSLEGERILTRLLRRMGSSPQVVLKRWPSNEVGREARATEEEFRESIITPTLQAWYRYCYPPIIEFLQGAENYYSDLKRRENLLNYQDLLLETVRLLRENPEVRGYFQEKYTHLLVDEFQDTDPLQAEIVMYLTGDNPGEKNWTALKPRPGALFIVGDPKQSIYRFRRADIDIYTRVKDQVENSGGEVLRLSTNFRSAKSLVEWANGAFYDLLGRETPPYQAEYGKMDYFNVPAPGMENGVRILATEKVPYNRADVICSQEAERIASFIGRAIQGDLYISSQKRNARPEDFLIIIPYKKYMPFYARALEQAALPFSLSGGAEIGSCRELVELNQVFKAILDPNNPVPLLAALRGIYFGVSDEELYRLKSAGGRFSFLSELPPETGEKLKEAWERLQSFRQFTRDLSPAAAMSRIVEELGALPLALSAPLGRSRAGYILQALELVQEREKRGATDFASNVDFIDELLQGQVEEELDPEGGLVGVRLMNLHKAKGLEAPVVFLANPVHDPSFPPEFHVTRQENQARGYLEIKDERGVVGLPPDWEYYQDEEGKYLAAESKRLLYVAATRARDLLIVSIYRGNEKKSFWYPLNSYLVGARELEEKNFSPPVMDKKEEIKSLQRQNFYNLRDQKIKAVTRPSYRRDTVTGIAEYGQYPQRAREKGRGTAWGNVIHRALEKIEGFKLPPNGFLLQLIKEEQLDPNKLDLVRAQLQKVMESPLWARVREAEKEIREGNFGFQDEDLYLTGTADLLFREKGEWVIVDYKSDVVEDDQHLQELIGYYKPQIEMYSQYWEKLTGEKVKERGILFTDIPTYYSWGTSGGGEK